MKDKVLIKSLHYAAQMAHHLGSLTTRKDVHWCMCAFVRKSLGSQRSLDPTALLRAPDSLALGIQWRQHDPGKGPGVSPALQTGLKHFTPPQDDGAVGDIGAAHGLGPIMPLCVFTTTPESGRGSQYGQLWPGSRLSIKGS